MPCLACRNHFREWSGRKAPERYAGRDLAREWLWSLHNEVNKERGAIGPAVEQLPDLYGRRTSQELNDDYKKLLESFQTAVQQRMVPPEAFMTFKMRLVALRQIVG